MKDEEIKRMLENVKVEPSPHCWEAIEGQLAAGAGAAGAGAAKIAGHALSTTAKVIIGAAVSTVAIATTVVILVLSSNSPTPQDPQTANLSPSFTDTLTVTTPESTTEVGTPTQNNLFTEAEIVSNSTTEPIPQSAQSECTGCGHCDTPSHGSETPKSASPTLPHTVIVPQTTQTVNLTPTETAENQQNESKKSKPVPTNSKPQNTSITDMSDPVLEDAETLNSIDFTPPVALFIPNIITPNGDGYNDVFIIQGIEQCERSRLIIRNGNGSIVFQTVDYQNNWDGANLADGTYFYQLVYTLHGIDETRTGTLTIVR